MAIYHCSVKTISRSGGRSAVASAAYRSGQKLTNDLDGEVHDYTRKAGVLHTEIVAPGHAPAWCHDRERLWNEVELAEKRKNSTVAREYEVALPAELGHEEQVALTKAFAEYLAGIYGVVADVAIHVPGREGDQRNAHAHILTSTREITSEGFGSKTRVLDGRQNGREEIEKIREKWAELTNQALERAGIDERVDHRSHVARGLDQEPTVHLGVAASAMERRGERTERGDLNRVVFELTKDKRALAALVAEIQNAGHVLAQNIPLRASQTAIEGGNSKFWDRLSSEDAKSILEASRRELAAGPLAEFEKKRALERLELEKQAQRRTQEYQDLRDDCPQKRLLEPKSTFYERERAWGKDVEAARHRELDTRRAIQKHDEDTRAGQNSIRGKAFLEAKRLNPEAVEVIEEERRKVVLAYKAKMEQQRERRKHERDLGR